MLLLITRPQEPHAERIEAVCRKKQIDYTRYHLGDFPVSAGLSIYPDQSSYPQLYKPDGTAKAFAAIDSVWYYMPDAPTLSDAINPEFYDLTLQEAQEAVRDFHMSLWDCFWMNAPHRKHMAANKLSQLRVAAQIGMRTPDSIVTNSAEKALQFVNECGGAAVYKPVMVFRKLSGPNEFYNATVSVVTDEMIAAQPEALSLTPNMFQAFVPKAAEVTVYVIGDRVLSAEIIPVAGLELADVDWRMCRDSFKVANIPDRLSQQCIDMTRQLGLQMCNFDFAVTAEGEYFFLDANPTEQWLHIEDATGLAITETVVDVLAMGRKSPAFEGWQTQ